MEKELESKVPAQPTNLRIYNQFPRSYGSLRDMMLDLERIAKLGFNAVWVNPLLLVSTFEIKHSEKPIKGSLYAPVDYTSLVDPKWGTQDDLKAYLTEARKLGLTPMFDLVLRHIGHGSRIITSMQHWFLPYYAGKPMSDVDDFIYTIPEDWKDRRGFFQKFYADVLPIWTKEIFPFWKRYITRMIELGFQGARIDAIRYLPAEIQHDVYKFMDDECLRVHHKRAAIFGELLFGGADKRNEILHSMSSVFGEDSRLTHIINSLYYQPFNVRSYEGFEPEWKCNGDTLATLKMLAEVTSRGGTIGFAGSHDELPLVLRAFQDHLYSLGHEFTKSVAITHKDEINKYTQPILKLMKRIVAAVTMTSNGGWCLLCGDEFGSSSGKKVFDWYKETTKDWLHPRNPFNICPFITEINAILARLPLSQHGDWFEHIHLADKPDLLVIVRHHGSGFEGGSSLILLNTDTTPVTFTREDLEKVASKAKELSVDKNELAETTLLELEENHIFCTKDVKIELELRLEKGLK